MKRLVPLLYLFAIAFSAEAQSKVDSLKSLLAAAKHDTTRVNLLNDLSRNSTTSLEACLQYANEAKALSEKINFQKGLAYANKNLGLCYYYKGDYENCLTYWNESLSIFQQINDTNGQANLLSNIGMTYKNIGIQVAALENLFKALKIAEQRNDKERTATVLSNIGATYFDNPATKEKALSYYLDAVKIMEGIQNNQVIGTIYLNIGEIYLIKNDLPNALLYFTKSREQFEQNQDNYSLLYSLTYLGKVYAEQKDFKRAIDFISEAHELAIQNKYELESALCLQSLGDTHLKMKDYSKAISFFDQAQQIDERIGAVKELKNVYEGFASAYASLGDYRKGFEYQQKLAALKDNLFSEENAKTIQRFQIEFDVEKKEAQIQLLTKDKELQSIVLAQQRNNIYALVIGACLLVALAFFLLKNIKIKTQANTMLSLRNKEIMNQKEEISAQRDDLGRQREEIERLMLNILPVEVAQELRKTGTATPRYYECVTVLFTDFREFTNIAKNLSAQQLVEELNECFIAFDKIIDPFGLEKIKTIGDAYMCASGVPTGDPDHAHKAVRAALAIQHYMKTMNEKRRMNGQVQWELRVGLHSGPVVAGVVGKKKFAYDIWGSTVNIANRLESSGEVGRVNISSTTYQLVKDSFQCHYRGKVQAKSMGEVDMYFVEKEIVTDGKVTPVILT